MSSLCLLLVGWLFFRKQSTKIIYKKLQHNDIEIYTINNRRNLQKTLRSYHQVPETKISF